MVRASPVQGGARAARPPGLRRGAQRRRHRSLDAARLQGTRRRPGSQRHHSPGTRMTEACTGTEALLLDLEAARCEAMKRADFARLREILHPSLMHVHAKGQVDDYESYFR